ncbi:MAG: amidase, partial [Actinomycetia bacterium]|nr:amidase [Actinomycetes bacterium]
RPSAFRTGSDTPRDLLERCLDTIAGRDDVVRAWVILNEQGARAAADASTARWRSDSPLSPIDGMPIGIKDLLETVDMPTEQGCAALAGNYPKRDNAAVWALRRAGAIIVGKTVTAELGGSEPGPTTNPFDSGRTPGGSSSGSAAAVGARMIPAAIGSQVGGSIIRPAGYCGNVALKPSQGGINRGERQATSMSTHGVHAGCVEDTWRVAIEIVNRVGGDRGQPGIIGPVEPPTPTKPRRLVVLETQGWPDLDNTTRRAFDQMLDGAADAGIELITRRDDPLVESLEHSVRDARSFCGAITVFENRLAQRALIDEHPGKVSRRLIAGVEYAERLTVDDYRRALERRSVAQACHRAVAGIADATVTLSCPGPAHLWSPDDDQSPRPTGDFLFNAPASLMFAPAVSVPMLAVDNLPVGVQVVGQREEDYRTLGIARWLHEELTPVALTS